MYQLQISPFWKQCYVTAAVFLTAVGHGTMVGFPAIMLPQLRDNESDLNYTEEAGSWIASMNGITMIFGSLITPLIMGRLGRKVAHFVVIGTLILGWVTVILAKNIETVVVGRAIHGISMGMTLPLRSVIIGECTSPKYRGTFLTTISVAQSFGLLLVHLTGSLISWQMTILIISSFPIASFLMTLSIPETPSWLADKGKYDQCRQVFRWFRGDKEEEELEKMINATINKSNQPAPKNENLFTLIKKKEFYKPIIIMVHCYLMCEFSGGALLAVYSTYVISLLAGDEVDPHFWMVCLDIQRAISNFVAIFVINRFKRRTMILSTAGLCILSNIAIACYVYIKNIGLLTYTATWVPFLLINVQVFSIAVGMVCLPFIIAGEIFPLQYRSVGGSISIIATSLSNFLVAKTFLAMTGAIGLHGSYGVYAGVMTCTLLVVWFMLPETKGKTLQEIEEHFTGKPVEFKELSKEQVSRL